LLAFKKLLRPHSFNRFWPLNGTFSNRRDWAGENRSTSSYQPFTRILSSGLLIVDIAQTSRQAGFSARGAYEECRSSRAFLQRSSTYKRPLRSEEHTSELQSRFDLVCRLLLEKKKNNNLYIPTDHIKYPSRD